MNETVNTRAQPVRQVAPAEPDARPEGVVLIHGLGRTPASMWLLAKRLQKAGFEVHRARYASTRSATDSAANEVAQAIAEVSEGWSRVHLVGHSLGGVIARRLALTRPDLRIGRVVQLGSPNRGSEVAVRLADHELPRRAIGPVLADIAGYQAPAGRDPRIGAIAGTADWGLPRRVHGLTGPHDGLVTVRSAWSGAGARAAVDVNHTFLPFSARVARLTIEFLRTGSFGPRARKRSRR